MTPVSHGKPCAGNPHARFEEGASASEEPRREGLLYTNNYTTANPQFLKPGQYPKDSGQRVRYLHITRNGLLIAATTDGLVTAQLGNDVNKMTFYRHQRESDRAESLSCSATMDVIEDGNGQVWISTESGGVNMISEGDLLK